jgi:hypothetical protein
MDSSRKLTIQHDYAPIRRRGLSVELIAVNNNEAVAYQRNCSGENEGLCALFHLREGTTTRHELQIPHGRLMEDPYGRRHQPALFRVGRQLALLVNTKLVYLVSSSLEVTAEIEIENDLPVALPARGGSKPQLRYPLSPACPSDSDLIPMKFCDHDRLAPDAHHLGMLRIDVEPSTAEWVPFGGQLLFHLPRTDFPASVVDATETFSDAIPLVYDALFRQNGLHVYTSGLPSNYIKWGMHFWGLTTYDRDVRLVDSPWIESDPENDEKKRGRLGDFTSSGRYCILTPVFPSADAWKRKQRLFDLDQQTIHEVKLPRGYTKYNLVDHADDTFWLMTEEFPREVRIASCSADC